MVDMNGVHIEVESCPEQIYCFEQHDRIDTARKRHADTFALDGVASQKFVNGGDERCDLGAQCGAAQR